MNRAPKAQTVDLLQQCLRTWLQPSMAPAAFDKMMRDSEWMRLQPNHIQVMSRFEMDPQKRQMVLTCVFSFPEHGLILPPGVGKKH